MNQKVKDKNNNKTTHVIPWSLADGRRQKRSNNLRTFYLQFAAFLSHLRFGFGFRFFRRRQRKSETYFNICFHFQCPSLTEKVFFTSLGSCRDSNLSLLLIPFNHLSLHNSSFWSDGGFDLFVLNDNIQWFLFFIGQFVFSDIFLIFSSFSFPNFHFSDTISFPVSFSLQLECTFIFLPWCLIYQTHSLPRIIFFCHSHLSMFISFTIQTSISLTFVLSFSFSHFSSSLLSFYFSHFSAFFLFLFLTLSANFLLLSHFHPLISPSFINFLPN